jgi:hypothetical protein
MRAMEALRRTAACGVCCLLAIAVTHAAAQQPSPDAELEALLGKATWYALDFVDKLSSVVAEERYVQDSNVFLAAIAVPGLGGRGGAGAAMSSPRGSAKHRELKSDFLIVKSAGEFWQPFRDVFEVDHIPMRDREQRLAKLFLGEKTDAEMQERGRAIADESARYNLGAVQRTINNPVFALIFLQPDARTHFRFTMGKPDRKMGDNIRVVEYVEDVRPTLIVGLPGQDMPAYGRFWIESGTGRVVKSEVRVDQKGIKANLTTVYRPDERLGIDVPSEMHEDYELDSSHVTGIATYSRFRRFEVNATEELAQPAPAATPAPQ